MNRLTHVESQRIIALLDETIQRIQLISLIKDFGFTAADYSDLLANDIVDDIKVHKTLEDTFLEQAGTRKLDDSMTIGLSDTADKFRNSTLTLCRKLMQPNVIDRAKQNQQIVVGTRPQPLRTFTKNLSDLKDLTFTGLITTVEEEKSKEDFLLDIQSKEQKSSVELKNLQAQLTEMRAKHEKDVSQKNQIVQKLKDEVQEIKSNGTMEMKRIEQDTNTAETKDIREHTEKDASQTEDLIKLDQNLEDIVKTNKKTEHNLRKKKLKTEAEVEKWVKKYDTEMEEKETMLQEMTEEYDSITKELAELEEQYATLTKERDEFLAVEREIQDAHMLEVEKVRHLHHSAAVIQRWWREMYTKLQNIRSAAKKGPKSASKKKRSSKTLATIASTNSARPGSGSVSLPPITQRSSRSIA